MLLSHRAGELADVRSGAAGMAKLLPAAQPSTPRRAAMLSRAKSSRRFLVRALSSGARLFGKKGAVALPPVVRVTAAASGAASPHGDGVSHSAYRLALLREVKAEADGVGPQAIAALARAPFAMSFELPQAKTVAHWAKFISLPDASTRDTIRKSLGEAARQTRGADAALAKSLTAPFRRTASVQPSDGVLAAMGGASPAAGALVQALVLGDDVFNSYKTVKDGAPTADALSSIELIVASEDVDACQEEARWSAAVASGSVLARHVAGERADVAHPQGLAAVAEAIVAEAAAVPGLSASLRGTWGEAGLLDADMNMFAAVGQAAGRARPDTHSPQLIEIVLSRGGGAGDGSSAAKPVVMLGKAVTFDSGGLNLKPTGSIETMHLDKGGGAAVLGAALATVRAGGPPADGREYVFAVAACENAIGAHAYKPHAILRSAKGTTVEVGNTDAEGRLVLADAMTRLQAQHKPGALVDVATLTGACVVALGSAAAGLFSNAEPLAADLCRIGREQGEPFWRLPVLEEHREALRKGDADIRSTAAGRGAGASTAAAFLEHFVDEGVAWAHLDIAGAGMRDAAWGMHPAGATGHGSQTLATWVLSGKAGEAADAGR